MPPVGRAARLRRGVPLAPRSTATFRRPRAVRPAAGAQSADAGRCAAAGGPSLAATSPPIVSGGGRALPAALGPGSGAACVWRGVQHGSLPRPLPCRQVKERARRGARRPPPFPRPCPPLGLRFLSSLHFVSVSAHGRLMEGRIHRPLYPARPVSWALLLAFATGFGVSPFSSSPHTFRRRLGCGRVGNKSFDFRTHIDPLQVGALGPPSMVEGLQCL